METCATGVATSKPIRPPAKVQGVDQMSHAGTRAPTSVAGLVEREPQVGIVMS
jgi:hypothetical protein